MSALDRPLQEAKRELYEIMRSAGRFERKSSEALELGRRYLDVDNAHLTRIDQETAHWEALVSTDAPGGQFPPGLELDLGETYCRRTLESDGPVALHDAPEQGWTDDPAFETHGLHCYHGTTLFHEEEPFGTVCFVSTEPRDEPFSDSETMFAELLTRSLETELEREHYEAELTRRSNLVNVLNRVLRHNLRNDMCVVRGRIQHLADRYGEQTHSDKATQKIDKLLNLCEKARELERIVGEELDRQERDIVALVEDVAGRIESAFPDARIIVDADEAVTAAVLPSFERAVEELIENAAKHGGVSPTVTITVENVPNAVEVRIADDGPGLSEPERAVLGCGVETPLAHGSGLGLWLTHWIVTSHDGSVDPTVTDEGTTMIVRVPRAAETNAHQQVDELRQARDRYQAAFEDAFDAIVMIDDEATIVDANDRASEIYGLDRRELIGHSVPEFLPEDFDFEAAWEEFKRSGSVRDTVTAIDADGVRRPVEYSATTNIVPGQHLLIVRERGEEVEQPQMYTQ
jgi:PAS domain S-box-containing protein